MVDANRQFSLKWHTRSRFWLTLAEDFSLGNGIALDPAGRIVAAGYFYKTIDSRPVFLLRSNANGSPDSSFDGDGIVIIPGLRGIGSVGSSPTAGYSLRGRLAAIRTMTCSQPI